MKTTNEILDEIFKLAEAQPKYVSAQLIRSLKYREHFKYLCELTVFAPFPKYSISEKIWLAKHKMTGFPCCKNCGKFLDKPGNFLGLTRGFRDFCSCKCSMNSQSTAAKRKETVKRIYGVENVFQNETVKQKCRETCSRNFGVPVSTLNSLIFQKQRQSSYSYEVDGIRFDSSLECCFYVFNRDHQIKCEYSPDLKFKYSYDGRDHLYFPDFRMQTGEIIEIKGKHFFKDGKMINPFRDPKWNDAQYVAESEKYEAKRQCMLANSVKILTEDDLTTQLDYMRQKYGSNWRNIFRSK